LIEGDLNSPEENKFLGGGSSFGGRYGSKFKRGGTRALNETHSDEDPANPKRINSNPV